MFDWKRALILSPHPEDGELGCGGTVQRLMAAGVECWYASFTIAEKSTHPPFAPDAQRNEMGKSTQILGFATDRVLVRNWEVRSFPEHRQEILDYLLTLREDIRPDLVFCHCRDDIHQDHQTVSTEAIRAFKQSSILGYELPWNTFRFNADIYVELDPIQAKTKCEALSSYASRSYRPYLNAERLRQWMGMRGLAVETEYAECFEVIRMVYRTPDLSNKTRK